MSALVDSRRRRSRARLLWLIPAGGLMLLLAPVVLLAGAGNPPCSPAATLAPGVPAGSGGWEATAYGPPWGGIQGDGVTATGLDLTAGQPAYEIAVDPSVIRSRKLRARHPQPVQHPARVLRRRHRQRDPRKARRHLRLARPRRPGRLGRQARHRHPRTEPWHRQPARGDHPAPSRHDHSQPANRSATARPRAGRSS